MDEIPESIRFTEGSMYDASGKYIETPKCDKCKIRKSVIIGKDAYMYFCSICGK